MLITKQEQYIFIHDAILESLTCGDTEMDAGNLRAGLDKLLRMDQSGRTEMDHQFAVSILLVRINSWSHTDCAILQILDKVSPNPSVAQCVAAKRSTKNYLSEEFSPGIVELYLSTAAYLWSALELKYLRVSSFI